LLTQVQGVIAEYERAKITERYRRGKLWRSRLGEVIAWKPPYGYRRVARSASTGAHLVVYEVEAAVVRRIFDDYVAGGHSMREITRRLNADGVPSPTGHAVWGTSTIGRLLRNEAYVGRVYFNRTELVPGRRPGQKARQVRRPREQWIPITVPRIVADEVFEAAQHVSRDNSKWSPRKVEPGQWLLRQLLKCGTCGVGVSCHRMRGRNGTVIRYYYCRNHDPLRAGGEHRRCPERNIRADALDTFVFEQVRAVLERPELLLAGERAVTARSPAPDDELLAAQVARLDRKADATDAERRRLVDLYQAGLLELAELQRRAKDVEARRQALEEQRRALIAERAALAKENRLRQRVRGFAQRVLAALDEFGFEQRQKLLRLVVEEVRVTGWQVDIRLHIPLDPDRNTGPPAGGPASTAGIHEPVSSSDRLRSLGGDDVRMMDDAVDERDGRGGVGEDAGPGAERQVGRDHETFFLMPAADDLEEEVRVAAVVGQIPDLVHDQQRNLGAVEAQAAVEGAGGVLGGEVKQELAGGDEADGVAGEHGLVADVLGDHGLAEALVGDEHDVTGRGEEVEAQRGLDGIAIDPLGPGPVEVSDGLEAAEAGAGEAAFEAAAGALLLFLADDVFEELGDTPAVFGGERDEVVELGGGGAQAEGRELVSEGGRRGRRHRASPRGWVAHRARRRG
jgi:hypothetical protein